MNEEALAHWGVGGVGGAVVPNKKKFFTSSLFLLKQSASKSANTVTRKSRVNMKLVIPSMKFVGKQFLFTFYLAACFQHCTEAIFRLISKNTAIVKVSLYQINVKAVLLQRPCLNIRNQHWKIEILYFIKFSVFN